MSGPRRTAREDRMFDALYAAFCQIMHPAVAAIEAHYTAQKRCQPTRKATT